MSQPDSFSADDLLAVLNSDNERCPHSECRGDLDTGWECNRCGYDAKWIVDRHDALADRGDRMHPNGLYFGEMA
jgi:hypothetical protein